MAARNTSLSASAGTYQPHTEKALPAVKSFTTPAARVIPGVPKPMRASPVTSPFIISTDVSVQAGSHNTITASRQNRINFTFPPTIFITCIRFSGGTHVPRANQPVQFSKCGYKGTFNPL
ncbi:hypothetical protein [Coprobacter secundus]|uniref:hypothetical protein n=1 Tax=Coprobacter secundus TaxID=1501392 RepID=UPI00387E9DDB